LVRINKSLLTHYLRVGSFILLIFLSGCISVSETCDESGNCSYDPSLIELQNACLAAAQPPNGYPFCTTESNCTSLFKSNFVLETDALPAELTNMLNNSQNGIINAWYSSNNAAKFIADAKSECDIDFIDLFTNEKTNIFTDKVTQYDAQLNKFRSEYQQFHENQILSMYFAKSYLENQGIVSLSETNLYKDYIELTDLINNYAKKLGKEINIKSTYIEDDASFYLNYFGENKDSIANLFADSSAYGKCLIENDNNIDICYGKELGKTSEEIKQNIITYFASGTIGSTVFLTGALVAVLDPMLFSVLGSTVFISDYFGNWALNVATKFSAIENEDEWKTVAYGKPMFESFKNVYGPASTVIFKYYDLMTRINKDIFLLESSLANQQNEFNTKIKDLKSKLLDKKEFYLRNKSLYVVFGKNSNYESLDAELNTLTEQIDYLQNETLGIRYTNYKKTEQRLIEIEDIVLSYSAVDKTYLLLNCGAYIVNAKEHIGTVVTEQNALLHIYIDKFESSKSDEEKLSICNEFISVYDPNIEYSCLDALKKFSFNIGISYPEPNAGECNTFIQSVFAAYQTTEDYYVLQTSYYDLLERKEQLALLQKKDPACVKYKDIASVSALFSSQNNLYTLDPVLSQLFTKNKENLQTELAQKQDLALSVLSAAIGCYFVTNYEINSDAQEILFDAPFDLPDVSYNVVLPLADLITDVRTGDCLKQTDFGAKYITFNFKCVNKEMDYKILFREQENLREVKQVSVSTTSADIIEEYCATNTTNTDLKVSLLVPYEYISAIKVYKSNMLVNSDINPDELIIHNPTIYRNKICYDIHYDTLSPISIDYDYGEYPISDSVNRYDYSVAVKNMLNLELKNINVEFPNTYVLSNTKISAIDEAGRTYGVRALNNKFSFNISGMLPYAEKVFSMSFNADADFDNVDDVIGKTIIDLNQYTDFVDANVSSSASSLILKLKNLLGDSSKAISEKRSIFTSLKKQADVIVSAGKTVQDLELRYNAGILRLNNIKSAGNKYDDEIKNKYSKYISNIVFSDTNNKISEAISQANSAYSKRDVKGAVKILESYKDDFGIDSILKKLFNNLVAKQKEQVTNAKMFDLDYAQIKTDQDIIGTKVQYNLSVGNIDDALQGISEYVASIHVFDIDISSAVAVKKQNILSLLTQYDVTKQNLNNFWIQYSDLKDAVASQEFSLLLQMGVKFSFNQKDLETIKSKLDKLVLKTSDLDKTKTNFESNKNNADSIGNFDTKQFSSFFNDVNIVNNTLIAYNKEMQQKAETEILLASSKFGADGPVELYKAKEYYDQNRYIDSIYFAKTSLFGLSNNSSNTYGWIIGIIFLLFLLFIFVRYRKLFPQMFKNQKKVQRVTYYTVDKDDASQGAGSA